MTTRDFLSTFIDAAIEQGAQALVDTKRANRAYTRKVNAVKALREAEASWPDILQQALDHENMFVRVSAARYLLTVRPEAAVPVLEAAAKMKGVVGIDGMMILREWRAGRLSP